MTITVADVWRFHHLRTLNPNASPESIMAVLSSGTAPPAPTAAASVTPTATKSKRKTPVKKGVAALQPENAAKTPESAAKVGDAVKKVKGKTGRPPKAKGDVVAQQALEQSSQPAETTKGAGKKRKAVGADRTPQVPGFKAAAAVTEGGDAKKRKRAATTKDGGTSATSHSAPLQSASSAPTASATILPTTQIPTIPTEKQGTTPTLMTPNKKQKKAAKATKEPTVGAAEKVQAASQKTRNEEEDEVARKERKRLKKEKKLAKEAAKAAQATPASIATTSQTPMKQKTAVPVSTSTGVVAADASAAKECKAGKAAKKGKVAKADKADTATKTDKPTKASKATTASTASKAAKTAESPKMTKKIPSDPVLIDQPPAPLNALPPHLRQNPSNTLFTPTRTAPPSAPGQPLPHLQYPDAYQTPSNLHSGSSGMQYGSTPTARPGAYLSPSNGMHQYGGLSMRGMPGVNDLMGMYEFDQLSTPMQPVLYGRATR